MRTQTAPLAPGEPAFDLTVHIVLSLSKSSRDHIG